MKMSEVFTGGKVVEIGGYGNCSGEAFINTEEHGFGTDEDGVSEAVIHAINMHDELVDSCIGIYNDYSKDEVSKMPPSIINAWELGEKFYKGES